MAGTTDIERVAAELAAEMAEMDEWDVPGSDGRTYKRRELRLAFEAVQDPADWKGPVRGLVAGEAVMATVEAVKFFTATVPSVEVVMHDGYVRYLIQAEGYRAGPAGDH